MKQANVNLPSGTYMIMGVRDGAKMILKDDMPPGNWQLLGADPTRLTEIEAGEIVEYWTEDCEGQRTHWSEFKNYTDLKADWFTIATESLESLAASLGIEKPFVILKLKDNDNT